MDAAYMALWQPRKERDKTTFLLVLSNQKKREKTALNAVCEVHSIFFFCTFLLHCNDVKGEEQRQKRGGIKCC